jgi:Astacin (Peptidase family M12A)
MTKGPLVLLCLTVTCIALPNNASRAQSQDPHLPPPRVSPSLDQYVVVDDMLLTPEYYAELTAPALIRRQAHPLGLGVSLANWDWGVIPYEIAPGFSATELQNILAAMRGWESVAPIRFVPRTTQSGFLAVILDNAAPLCTSNVAQLTGLGRENRVTLTSACARNPPTSYHELGHAIGFNHEHQRSDRDNYLAAGPTPPTIGWAKLNFPLIGPYDFLSVMHYGLLQMPGVTLLPQYQGMRVGGEVPSATDHNVAALLYDAQLRESQFRAPTEATRTRFDRGDMLTAMERLNAFYTSRIGLQRPQGLSIDGKPDFLGIAQWVFDIYLPARSAGFSQIGAFDIVVAAITRTDEWRTKNPGRTPLTPSTFRPAISFSRDEFLDVLNRLDRFYSAPEGLQRPNGLSISGGPDFLGIATWIFDIYLAERLNGISPNGAWTITENAIRSTNEWRGKH